MGGSGEEINESSTQSVCCILTANNPAPAPEFSNTGYAPGNQPPYGHPQYAAGNFYGRLPGYRSVVWLGGVHGKQEVSSRQPPLIYNSVLILQRFCQYLFWWKVRLFPSRLLHVYVC